MPCVKSVPRSRRDANQVTQTRGHCELGHLKSSQINNNIALGFCQILLTHSIDFLDAGGGINLREEIRELFPELITSRLAKKLCTYSLC